MFTPGGKPRRDRHPPSHEIQSIWLDELASPRQKPEMRSESVQQGLAGEIDCTGENRKYWSRKVFTWRARINSGCLKVAFALRSSRPSQASLTVYSWHVLNGRDFRCATAPSGPEPYARSSIVLDLSMPQMNGW